MKQKSLHTSYHAPKLLKFSSTTLIASFCLLKLTPGMALTKASAIGNPNDTGYLGSVFPVSKVVPCLFPENKITQKPCSTYNNSPFLESFQAVLPDLGQVPLLRLRPAVSVQNLEPARQSMQEKVSDFQLSDAQPLTSNEVSQPMVLIPSIPTTQKLSTITSHDAGTVQISSSPNLEPSDFQLAQVLLPAPSNALGHSPVPTATLVKAEVLEVLTEPPKPSDFQLAQVLLPTPSNALDHSPIPTATLVKAEVLEVLTEPPKPSDFQLAQVLLPTPSNALDHSPVPTATLVKAEVLTQPDFVAPLVEVLVRKSEQATPTSTTVTHLNVQDTPLPLASSALEPTPYLRLTPPLSHAKLSHNEFAKLEPGLYQPKPIPTTSPLAPHLHEVASLEQLHQPNSLLDAPKLVSQTSFSDHPPSYLDPVAVPIVSFAQPTVKTQATENDSKDLVFQLDHISLPPAWSQNQYAPNGHLVTVQISVPITQDPTPYIISLPSPQIEPVAYQLADVALPSSFLPSHLATTQIVATGSEFVPSSIHLIEGQILTSQLAYVATEMSIDWVAGSFQKDTQPDSLMAGQTFERLYAFPEELEERILAENTSKTTLDDLLVAQTKSNADYRLEHIQIPQPFQLVAVQKFTAPLWITEVKPKLDWPLNHVQIPALYSFPQISSEIESVSTALDDTAKVEPDVTWQVADFYMGPPSLQALPTSDSYGYRSLLKLPPPYFNWQSKDRYIYSFNDPHARITKNRIGLLVDFADD